MRRLATIAAFLLACSAPAFAQKPGEVYGLCPREDSLVWVDSIRVLYKVLKSTATPATVGDTSRVLLTTFKKQPPAQRCLLRAVAPPPTPPPVTPLPPTTGGTHEPAGMTTVIDSRGNDKLYGRSAASPAPWFFGARWLDDSKTAVVKDSTAPFGSAIEKRFFVGDVSGWNGLAQLSFGFPTEVYYRLRFKFSANWQDEPGGQKFFYWGSQGAPTMFFVLMTPSHGIDVNVQTASMGSVLGPDWGSYRSSVRVSLDAWHTIEVHAKAQSAFDKSDGSISVWFDGQYIADWAYLTTGGNKLKGTHGDLLNKQFLGVGSTNGERLTLGGLEQVLYWGGANNTKTVNDWIRQGELVVKSR